MIVLKHKLYNVASFLKIVQGLLISLRVKVSHDNNYKALPKIMPSDPTDLTRRVSPTHSTSSILNSCCSFKTVGMCLL